MLLGLFWAERINQSADCHNLLCFHLCQDLWLVVDVDVRQELVKDLGNRLLVNVLQQVLNDGGLRSENKWEKKLLFSADQKRDKFAKVSRKDWVEFIISLDELEESFKQDIFISFLFILFFNSFSCESCLGDLG